MLNILTKNHFSYSISDLSYSLSIKIKKFMNILVMSVKAIKKRCRQLYDVGICKEK